MKGEQEVDIRDLKEMIDGIVRTVTVIPPEHIERLIEAMERQHAFQPLMDPTGWMLVSKLIQPHIKVYRTLLELRLAVEDADRVTKEAVK